MTTLSTSVPPHLTRHASEWRDDLLADLRSLLRADDTHPPSGAIFPRPSILSRLAAIAAERIPPGADRLIGCSDDAILLAAVSLHSGIPLVCGGTSSLIGTMHAGEGAVLIAYDDTRETGPLISAAREAGVGILHSITLFSTQPSIADHAAVLCYPALRFAQGDEQ